MAQTTYLVVGASRGIGKAIVDLLGQDTSNHIYATTRKTMDFGRPNIQNIILDQTDSIAVDAAKKEIQAVDVLIVNAAMGDLESVLTTSTERLQQYVDTNIVGVHRVINAFVPALRAGKEKKIIIISSVSASLSILSTSDFPGFQGPYSVTKAANNMQAVQYHNELHKQGFSVIALSPGWVATDMGNIVKATGDFKPMPPEESAGHIIKRVKTLKHEESGSFYSHEGSILPW